MDEVRQLRTEHGAELSCLTDRLDESRKNTRQAHKASMEERESQKEREALYHVTRIVRSGTIAAKMCACRLQGVGFHGV